MNSLVKAPLIIPHERRERSEIQDSGQILVAPHIAPLPRRPVIGGQQLHVSQFSPKRCTSSSGRRGFRRLCSSEPEHGRLVIDRRQEVGTRNSWTISPSASSATSSAFV